MNQKHTKLLVLSVLSIAVITWLTVEFCNRGSSPKKQNLQALQPTQLRPASIPPATLPPVAAISQMRVASQLSNPATSVIGDQFLYDEQLSFESNLQRLKGFCISHGNDPQLQLLIDQFVKNLFAHSKGQFQVVKNALAHLDGPPIFDNIILACLIAADGPISEKADIVWAIATDKTESVETRRLSTHLILQFKDGKSRPAQFLSLLEDSDSAIIVLATKMSPLEMDKQSYNVVKNSLLASSDINVRIAAVDAIGSSTIPDKQADLLKIINDQPTSKATMFSDASLLKRKAIAHLDLNNPQTYKRDQDIALDSTEDPSVRAAAIRGLTPDSFPSSTNILLGLLQSANSDDAVVLAATEDSLLTTPTPNILQVIRTKAGGLSDPQLRDFMIKRLEKITNSTETHP